MKPVLLALTSLFLSALAGATGAAETCLTDTTQADFQQTGTIATNVDTATSSGDVILTSSSGGGGTVDQQNTTFTVGLGERCSLIPGNNQWCGQTFTAGKSGALSKIDLNMGCKDGNNAPSYFCAALPTMIVSVRATSGDLPTGTDLASTSFRMTTGAQTWYSANFAAPLNVATGTKYAIVIRPSQSLTAGAAVLSDTAQSSILGQDVYAGGAVIYSTNSGSTWSVETGPKPSVDGAFKTYIGSGSGGGYSSGGDLISSTKDSNPGTASTSWSTLSWHNAAPPTGTTLKFQAAASNNSTGPFTFVGPDGTSNSFFTTSGASLSQFNGNRYFKYRAYLSTGSSTATPTLNDATACYTTTTPIVNADLSITNTDGTSTANPGGTVTYAITASNLGPSSVTGATVTDAFPSSLTCTWTCSASLGSSCPASGSGNISSPVNLLNSGSATFSASCAISAAASGTITNTASISAPNGVTDPATGNNTATDTDSLGVGAGPPALSLTDSVEYVRVGDVVSYVIHVSNPGATIQPTITDALPAAQLSGQSWQCSPSGGATCGSSSGSGDTLSDKPTVPSGGAVDYTYTVSVLAANSNGEVSNTASMKITGGNAGTTSASDADMVVVFLSGFEGGTTPMAMTPAGSGTGVTAQFGVDGGLLTKLGPAPVTIASAQSASGQTLFSLQLMRSGHDMLLRSVTPIDGGVFSDVAPWQVVDLRALRLGFEWQSATTRGDDGFLRAGSASQQTLIAANNSREAPTQLQVAVVNGVPWLVLAGP